jgi:hypothetical protein
MYLQSVVAGTWTVDQAGVAVATGGAANKMTAPTLVSRAGLSQTPLAIRVARDGAAAGDVLTGDAIFLGVSIEQTY